MMNLEYMTVAGAWCAYALILSGFIAKGEKTMNESIKWTSERINSRSNSKRALLDKAFSAAQAKEGHVTKTGFLSAIKTAGNWTWDSAPEKEFRLHGGFLVSKGRAVNGMVGGDVVYKMNTPATGKGKTK